jgi:hypothetical protein
MKAYENWSIDVQERTKLALQEKAFIPYRDVLAMKHADGRFGTMCVNDILSGLLKVNEFETEGEESFADVEELIHAGWVVD